MKYEINVPPLKVSVHFQPTNSDSIKHDNLASSKQFITTTLAQFVSKQKKSVYSSD
jgi:hypothetical protein